MLLQMLDFHPVVMASFTMTLARQCILPMIVAKVKNDIGWWYIRAVYPEMMIPQKNSLDQWIRIRLNWKDPDPTLIRNEEKNIFIF